MNAQQLQMRLYFCLEAPNRFHFCGASRGSIETMMLHRTLSVSPDDRLPQIRMIR